MPRRIVEFELGLCFLIMIGTATVAEDEVVFDLSEARVQQVAAGPTVVTPAESSPHLAPVAPGVPVTAAPSGADEQGGGFFGWRPDPSHFDLPSRSYSLFRSPASYGWGYAERCAPTPWKPRGDGIPRRTSCFRMDYAPYQLENDFSKHGPAFYMRYELYPCEECHKHACHLQQYYGRRY